MSYEFRLPSITATDSNGKIAQLMSYQHQLVQEMNWAFNSLDTSYSGLGDKEYVIKPEDYGSIAAFVENRLNHKFDDKQDKLVAGDNITIAPDGKTISVGTVLTDNVKMNSLINPNLKVLGVGDSICYAYRDNHKGFIGNLGLPYKNDGVSSATLSTVTTTVKNIPTQLLDENEYSPDIIIANGGINDYIKNAPLGQVPDMPVTSDDEASLIDKSTVAGGLSYLFYLMIKKYPKAQRYFLLIHKVKNRSGNYFPITPNAQGYTQKDLNDLIVQMCELYGVVVIDVYNKGIIDTAFPTYVSPRSYASDPSVTNEYYVDYDGLHPLSLGYKEVYAPIVKSVITSSTLK